LNPRAQSPSCNFFFCRYISVPKALADTTNYEYPIGPEQFKEFGENGALAKDIYKYGKGNTAYRTDNRALKLISQSEWSVRNALNLSN